MTFWERLLLLLSRFSCVRLCATLQTEVHQAPPSLGFSRQEHWSELPFPSPGNLPHPEIEPMSLMSPELSGRFFTTSITWEAPTHARKGQMGSSEFSLSKAITRHPNTSPLAWHQRNSSRDSGHSPSPSVNMATMPWCGNDEAPLS